MEFFDELRLVAPVAHDVLLLSLTILGGIGIGNVRIAGIRLGVAGVMFAGLLLAHFGLTPESGVAHFLKDFGLVLFVFALGVQMGPGFFASLRRHGLRLNGYAALLVALGAGVAMLGGWLAGWQTPALVGVFSGATTNTPSLGAAQQALRAASGDGGSATLAAMAYAAAYPMAIVGIILSLIILRRIFRIDVAKEAEDFRRQQGEGVDPLERLNLRVENPNLDGLAFSEVPGIRETGVVISRIRLFEGDLVRQASPETILHVGDVILAVGTRGHLDQFRRVVGSVTDEDLMKAPGKVTYRRVVVTNRKMLGKTVRELGLDHMHGVTVTRVSRGDLNFTALPDLRLQFGDRLQMVGDEAGLDLATEAVGNAVHQLQETNFATIFAGILLGVLLGLYPFQIAGLPSPVKLGLAGGPLVVAILLGNLGRLGPLVMHLPTNANRALRELGIILFLANVGLLSGEHFVATVFTAQGLSWVLIGLAVTMLPLLLVGIIARKFDGMNYMNLSGLLSGGMTDPPALAFATGLARCDSPAVAYAAVYPLTMLLRIVAAQVMAQG
jgi:putative transport protein